MGGRDEALKRADVGIDIGDLKESLDQLDAEMQKDIGEDILKICRRAGQLAADGELMRVLWVVRALHQTMQTLVEKVGAVSREAFQDLKCGGPGADGRGGGHA